MSMTDATATIAVATTEAQAVLELVAHRLDTDAPIEPSDAFTLYVAVQAAIARLDAVHDALQATVATPEPLVAHAPGALQ
jgi:hypothetical protein